MSKRPIPHGIPTRWAICGTCAGNGASSAYLGAFTREQMDEDPDFAEDYMQGVYDRPCDDCEGTGKVRVIDQDRLASLDPEQREELRGYYEAMQEDDADRRLRAMEDGHYGLE